MARILVAGAGAIGSVFGGLLAHSGHDVTLLGRAAHMQAVKRRGLVVDGIWGRYHCRKLEAVTAPVDCGTSFDAVLVTVKSYDTPVIAEVAAQKVCADGQVISLQNGLGNLEVLARHIDPRRLFGGRVIFGARMVEPGAVEVTVCAEPVRIGPYVPAEQKSKAAAQQWASIFTEAGIRTEVCDSIEAELWAKAFYNAALNPLGALLGCNYGWLAENLDTRAIMNGVIEEAFAVAVAEKVPLRWASAEAYRAEFYSSLVPRTAAHRSSMLQDLEQGKRTEVDAINGEVWRRGERHGVPTPLNALLTRLIRAATARSQKRVGGP